MLAALYPPTHYCESISVLRLEQLPGESHLAFSLGSRMNTPRLPPSIERPTDAAAVFAIWPGTGVPPGSERWAWHEQAMPAPAGMGSTLMVRNVVVPTLTMFAPAVEAAAPRSSSRPAGRSTF